MYPRAGFDPYSHNVGTAQIGGMRYKHYRASGHFWLRKTFYFVPRGAVIEEHYYVYVGGASQLKWHRVCF